eukprot:m.554260 g.554260  ORF g.554260 m.554260 type:complete len:98 (+) comp22176_c0_seq7:1787-2080(+)
MEGTKIEKPAIASADNSVAEARETVVQRQAESGSFGFTIAQEYRGYTAKWVTFVAAAESHSNLVSGDQVRVHAFIGSFVYRCIRPLSLISISGSLCG